MNKKKNPRRKLTMEGFALSMIDALPTGKELEEMLNEPDESGQTPKSNRNNKRK